MSMEAVQIVFRPRFDLSEVAEPRRDDAFPMSEAAVGRWASMLPGAITRDADHEDWHENAAILFAAVDAGVPVYVMERDAGGDPEAWSRVACFFNTDVAVPADETPTVLLGSLLRSDPLRIAGLDVRWPDEASMRAANAYGGNPGFAAYAGRAITLAAHPDEEDPGYGGPDTLVLTVARIARDHGPELMLKVANRAKHSNPVAVDIPRPDDRADVERRLVRALEYDLVHIDGSVPRFLVQERIALEAEYRVVVVGLEPVAGAACVESMCPPWNRGERFHPVVEGERGSGELRVAPALVARYVAAAADAARAMHLHDPALKDGVFDFGLKPDGGIALIEVNACGNFGLYALDCIAFVTAVIQAAAHPSLDSRLPAP